MAEDAGRSLQLEEVSEKGASPEVAEVYGRIKDTLRANTVSPVWRVFATKPRFLSAVWDQLEPAVDEGFMQAAEAIRAAALERVREGAPSITDQRPALGDDLARADEQLRVHMEANPRALILLCALDRSWREGDVGGLRAGVETERGVPGSHPEVGEGTGGGLSELYDEMAKVLGLSSPPTDYLTLGQWPDFLRATWGELLTFVQTDTWTDICTTIESVAEQAALSLPAKIQVTPDRAGDFGLGETEVEEVGRWIQTFHGNLPGLIVNTSYFWLAMHGGTSPSITTAHPAGAPAPVQAPGGSAAEGRDAPGSEGTGPIVEGAQP